MKKVIVSLIVLSLMLGLSACKMIGQYNVNWIIGKNSDQIEARYGEFDVKPKDGKEYGLYRRCRCAYYLVRDQRNWAGRVPDVLLYIYFDEEGIAYAAKKIEDTTVFLSAGDGPVLRPDP